MPNSAFARKSRRPISTRVIPSLPYWLARQRQKRELLGEELRLLYVAMTRARDRLLLIGSVSAKNSLKRAGKMTARPTHHAHPGAELCRLACDLVCEPLRALGPPASRRRVSRAKTNTAAGPFTTTRVSSKKRTAPKTAKSKQSCA